MFERLKAWWNKSDGPGAPLPPEGVVRPLLNTSQRPTIVCLCGSTRFVDAFAKANLDQTLKGKIVLSIGCNMKSDAEAFAHFSEEEQETIKTKLDELHKRKIDLADEVLILNVSDYIGKSTMSELVYARTHGKTVWFWEPSKYA